MAKRWSYHPGRRQRDDNPNSRMAPERCSRSTLGPKGSNSASRDLPQPLAGRLLIPDRRAVPVQSAVGIDVAELSQPVFGVTGRPGMADLLGHSSIAITG